MDAEPSIAKLAVAVIQNCTNVLHAAYTNRKPGDDKGLQFLLDDVRKLAEVASVITPFWALNPAVRISFEFTKVLKYMRIVLTDCSEILARLELLLAAQAGEESPLGSRSFDFRLLRWKVQAFTQIVGLANGNDEDAFFPRSKIRRYLGLEQGPNDDGFRNIDKLREDAGWFQVATDQVDDRGETGVMLLVEILETDQHFTHIRDLVWATESYILALDRDKSDSGRGSLAAATRPVDHPLKEAPLPGYRPEGAAVKSAQTDDGTDHHLPTSAISKQGAPIGNAATADTEPDKFTPGDCAQNLFAPDAPAPIVVSAPSVTWAFKPAGSIVHSSVNGKFPNDSAVKAKRAPDTPSAASLKTEDERVGYLRQLITNNEQHEKDSDSLHSLICSFSLSVPAKLTVAERLYTTGKPDSTTRLLQLPLSEFPSDPIVRARLNHVLAKGYFAVGNIDRAIDNCKLSQIARKKALGHHHPLFLESTELLIHLFRATDRITGNATLRQFKPYQEEFLEQIDDLEVAFTMSKEDALGSMIELFATLEHEDSNPARSLLERLGHFTTWDFAVDVLGFGNRTSLLTILADINDYDRLMLLAIRGNVTPNLPPGRTRPVLDALLRSAALAGNKERVTLLLEIGADIEANRSGLKHSRELGPGYDSMTPLHLAANMNHIAVVQALVKHGANKEARDFGNNTPLMLADQNGHTDVVELLLENGAGID
ncbi:hypothetical protein BJY01DRAFT_248356 [Aspergillus pseudoustus]|uniref:Ankyrin repeat-containing domain protein n=1 Tax=Aspergillus pseudoustus TaxID=1810923 RepID=A0ABR4JVU4_9EURO